MIERIVGTDAEIARFKDQIIPIGVRLFSGHEVSKEELDQWEFFDSFRKTATAVIARWDFNITPLPTMLQIWDTLTRVTSGGNKSVYDVYIMAAFTQEGLAKTTFWNTDLSPVSTNK